MNDEVEEIPCPKCGKPGFLRGPGIFLYRCECCYLEVLKEPEKKNLLTGKPVHSQDWR